MRRGWWYAKGSLVTLGPAVMPIGVVIVPKEALGVLVKAATLMGWGALANDAPTVEVAVSCLAKTRPGSSSPDIRVVIVGNGCRRLTGD